MLKIKKLQKYYLLNKSKISFLILFTDPGTIEFDKPSFLFKESCGIARIPVKRVNGADGVLKANWRTKDISAVGGKDFENTSGELEFKHGEVEKYIEIIINDDMVSTVFLWLWIFPFQNNPKNPGPGCSKLTMSLVNETLKFQMLTSQICQ